MKTLYDLTCPSCGIEDRASEEPSAVCPECGELMEGHRYLVCDCGEEDHYPGFTNVCPRCKKLYNAFGQVLAPVEEWDPEDRYACFGPQ